MLVLTRKADDAIIIGDNITIKIISIEGNVVKLGIDAPTDISIIRSELLDAVEKSNIAASHKVDDSFLKEFYNKFKK
jgi:carbon storage regulator CsrA